MRMHENSEIYALVVSGTLNALIIALVVIVQIISLIKSYRTILPKKVRLSTLTRDGNPNWRIAQGYIETGYHVLLTIFAVYLLTSTDVIQHPFKHNPSTSSMTFIIIAAALGTYSGRFLYTLTSAKKFLANLIENSAWIVTYSVILSQQELQLVGLIGIVMEADRVITATSAWVPCCGRHHGYSSKLAHKSDCCAMHSGLRVTRVFLIIPCRFIIPFTLLTLGVLNENPTAVDIHRISVMALIFFFIFCGLLNLYRTGRELKWLFTNKLTYISECCIKPTFKSTGNRCSVKDMKCVVQMNNIIQSAGLANGGTIYMVKNIENNKRQPHPTHPSPSLPNTNVDTSAGSKLTQKTLLKTDNRMNIVNNLDSREQTQNKSSVEIQQRYMSQINSRRKAPNFAVLDTISEYSHPSLEVSASGPSVTSSDVSAQSPLADECWVDVEF